MAIPALNDNGELVEGEHEATLNEVEAVYGLSSARRELLMRDLRKAADNLQQAGVKKIWIDGSFVTGKEEPNDIDGCWEYNDAIDLTVIDPVFLGRDARDKTKAKYGLDFFVAQDVEAGSDKPFPKFFQINRDGEAKGIIVVNLGSVNLEGVNLGA